MVDDGHFSVGLLDLQLGGRRLHAQGVVVHRVDDHGGWLQSGSRSALFVLVYVFKDG